MEDACAETMIRKRVLSLLVTLIWSQESLCFVPQVLPTATRKVVQLFSTQRQHKSNNLFAKVSNKITSWLRPKASRHVETIGLLKKQKRDLDFDDEGWLLWKNPVHALERAVNRELTVEKRKAKPLLRQAQALIQKDFDVMEALGGKPIVIGSMVSQQHSTTVSNGKKTQQIWDSFQVAGPYDRGVATMVADKYAKGHIQSLHVVVNGIRYDIDV